MVVDRAQRRTRLVAEHSRSLWAEASYRTCSDNLLGTLVRSSCDLSLTVSTRHRIEDTYQRFRQEAGGEARE
jgi:hypothetical protein